MRALMVVVAGALALGASVAMAAPEDSAGNMCAFQLTKGNEMIGHCTFTYYHEKGQPLCFSTERSMKRYLQLTRKDNNPSSDQNYAKSNG